MSERSICHLSVWVRRSTAVVVLLFAMVLVACSSAPGPGTSNAPAGSAPVGSQPPAATVGAGGGAPTVNCQTISGADIATIIGLNLAEANPFGDIACTWTFTDKASGTGAGSSQSVYVRWSNDDITLDGVKSLYPGGEAVSIGDRGYWADGTSTLYVAKGAHVYAIDLSGLDTTDPHKDLAIQIAQLLLPKV